MTSNESLLPSHVGSVTDTVSASQITSGSNQGYTVTVNATATIGTTFMRLVEPTMTVSAKATAVNPQVTITLTTNGFKSSAWDGNTLWYWLISSAAQTAVPNPNDFASNQLIASNVPGQSPNAPVTFTATATQPLGIALQNVTGEVGGNYGCTQYQTAPTSGQWVQDGRSLTYVVTTGTCQGSTQWFFSNIMPPSGTSYDVSSVDTGYAAVTQNCSVQTALTAQIPTSLNPPTAGSCFNTLPANSVFSCNSIGGQYVTFYWNDMGGNIDDYDFNDAEISISCSGVSGGNNATGVYLAS
jgi:hypothetical protein